jgi:hypothetical protein
MCDAALERYEACMEERGLEWGMGWEDARDYRNWCETWTWEQGVLEHDGVCEDLRPTFTDGTCEDYDAAWESTSS